MEIPVDGMHDFKVRSGSSAETSGGLLAMLSPEQAQSFVEESEEQYGQKAWIVGQVVRGNRQAFIREDADVVSVRDPFMLK